MRAFPHFKGENSFLSVQLPQAQAKAFRNGATSGRLTVNVPTSITGFVRGRGWYRFEGNEFEIRRVFNYISNRIDALEREVRQAQTREIERLIHLEIGDTGVTPVRHHKPQHSHHHKPKKRAPTQGALAALERKFARRHV